MHSHPPRRSISAAIFFLVSLRQFGLQLLVRRLKITPTQLKDWFKRLHARLTEIAINDLVLLLCQRLLVQSTCRRKLSRVFVRLVVPHERNSSASVGASESTGDHIKPKSRDERMTK